MDRVVGEVIIAGIGFLGICVTTYIGYLKLLRERSKTTQLTHEMQFQRASLDFAEFMREWGGTVKELEDLMSQTNIDRFLILRAWNGYHDPRWTTAVFQLRRGSDQKTFSYVHFELDPDYVGRLKEIEQKGSVLYNVEDMEDCRIKQIYKAEGVTQAKWTHLDSRSLNGSDSRSITYCSFGTHADEGISEEAETRCDILAGRLKGVAYAFNGKIK